MCENRASASRNSAGRQNTIVEAAHSTRSAASRRVTMCCSPPPTSGCAPSSKGLKPGSRVVSSEFPVKGWRPFASPTFAKAHGTHHHVYSMGKTNRVRKHSCAASALLPTLGRLARKTRRDESRRGTQECVRYSSSKHPGRRRIPLRRRLPSGPALKVCWHQKARSSEC